MNHLIAKLKGVKGEFLKVISSEVSIIDCPDIQESQAYSPSYKLEEDEWFVLESLSNLGYINKLIDTEFSSTNFNQIKKEQYAKIDYLCCVDTDTFLFQKMSSSQILQKKWFQISEEPILHVNQPIIVLNNFVDAVYKVATNKLYFKDLARVKSIFTGIDMLFREATKDEVNKFLKLEFLNLTNGFDADSVKTANRKRITLAMDTFNNFSVNDKKDIFQYIQLYCADVPVNSNGDSFIVSSEEHLKKILFGIEQRYYTTPLGSEKRLANSVMAI